VPRAVRAASPARAEVAGRSPTHREPAAASARRAALALDDVGCRLRRASAAARHPARVAVAL